MACDFYSLAGIKTCEGMSFQELGRGGWVETCMGVIEMAFLVS